MAKRKSSKATRTTKRSGSSTHKKRAKRVSSKGTLHKQLKSEVNEAVKAARVEWKKAKDTFHAVEKHVSAYLEKNPVKGAALAGAVSAALGAAAATIVSARKKK